MIKYHEKNYGNILVNEFRDYLWGIKQIEESSINSYCLSLKKFCEFSNIRDNFDIKKINVFVIRNFIEYLKSFKQINGKKYKISTINLKIFGLNQFFESQNLNNLKTKSIHCKKKLFLNEDELLNDMDISLLLRESNKVDKKLYLEIISMIQTGMRVSEILNLTYETLEKGYIEIFNKGNRREVPMPIDLREKLKFYCKSKNILKGNIFITKNGKVDNRSNIYRKMLRLGKKFGISKKKLHPHNLRHYFAIKFIEANGENCLSLLSDILGHQNINTTRIYLRKTLSSISEKMTLESLKIII